MIVGRGRTALLVFAVVFSAAWVYAGTAPNPTPTASPAPGIDLAGIDRAVAPGHDFFAHANGTWLRTTEIPPDRAAYGAAGVVSDLTNRRTAELIQQAAGAGAPAGSTARKIGDFYATYHGRGGHRGQGPPSPPPDARHHRVDR